MLYWLRLFVVDMFSTCVIFQMQREQIWRALFGDTPVQSITSPFMLSPTATTDPKHSVAVDSNWSTPCHTCEPSSSERRTTAVCNASSPNTHVAPPKMGFVPREGNTSFRLRDDIRRLHLSSNYSDHSFTDESSPEIPSTVETPSAMGTNDTTISSYNTPTTPSTLSERGSIYTAGMSDTVNSSYTPEALSTVVMNDASTLSTVVMDNTTVASYTPATLSTVVMDDTTVASYTPATLSTVVMDDTTVASYTPATLSTVVMDDTTVASYTPATLSTVVMDDTTVASYTPATLSTVVMDDTTVASYTPATLSTVVMDDTTVASYTPATLSTVVMDDTTVASYTPATLSTVVMNDTTVASYTPATLSTVVMDDTTVASYTPATLSTVVMDDTTVASYTPATLSTVVMNDTTVASYTLSTAKMNDTVNYRTSAMQPLHDLVPLSSSSAADESESLEDTKLPQSSQHMNKQLVTCLSNTSYTASTDSTNGCEDCPQFDNLRSEAQLTCF